VGPEQHQWITTEHVADFPDIELRILSVPGCQPVLAEIVFPPSFSIDRAKHYIFQELEELAVQGSGSSLRWLEQNDRLVLRLADRDLAHGLVIDLMPGIREVLGTKTVEGNGRPIPTAAWQTCCLEFDRAAGWDRKRAGLWVQKHLGLRDLGRTVRLDVCYRMEPALAAFVSESLFVEAADGTATSPFLEFQSVERNGCSAAVEFVPVPELREAAGTRERRNAGLGDGKLGTGTANARPAALPRRGGAGLEIDLAEPRQRERLPAELRADLPNQGLVNYAEAQAVVRTLASLVKEPGGCARVDKEQRGIVQPTVAVLALYPAQAALIRRLMHQNPALAAIGVEVEVGVPTAFRQREAAVVLLSLTRSHTHRAVAFGEGPQVLALAMTRARSRLIVFGDPGTLVRRSQWEGPLEHLHEDDAARERQLIARLVHSLQDGGCQPQAAPVRQGSGT
jgi:hypothetical protein